MAEVFRTPAFSGETQALVVHCSSARFQQPFQAFLGNGLQLRRYSLIAIPGGVQVLTLLDYLPKFAWAGWRWMKFLVDLEKPTRLVLVAHDDCAWYRDLRFWQRRSGTSRERIIADLKRVAAEASERFPNVRVETYFASLVGGQAVFESSSELGRPLY